ncbi:thymidine phosphorylase [Candidatus Dojkabacteria bacterium]|uniref:Thymidine phosphorylase n=1 Tax=Candidatus Dojkabacteria bacterium TaxID=2099670 RepID=A0A955L3J7_9BACT|nr:thymidine phosphorylase [Candidatus Dojkabacteria bacterium]
MSLYLSAKKLDLYDGDKKVAVLHHQDASMKGINIGDKVEIELGDNGEMRKFNMDVELTESMLNPGQLGIFADDWEDMGISEGCILAVTLLEPSPAVAYIREKIKGNELSYDKMFAIMQDISNHKLNEVMATYFLSAFYTRGFTHKEVYYLTKAMAETGEILKFPDRVVADKHSIGGVGGKGVTPIVVSIAMAAGLLVPNTSTKAITTASATTDMLEAIMPMSFSKEQLETFAEEIGGFMVWGGGLDLAPADDILINVEKPLHLESYDKFTASIMAKKIAMGVTHLVLDMPKGPGTKVQNEADVKIVKQKFEKLASEFGIKIDIVDREVTGIDGNAVGPALESREFLYILERSEKRSLQLEKLSVTLAGKLMELAEIVGKGNGFAKAMQLLESGEALKKFLLVVEKQGGDPQISSDKMTFGEFTQDLVANSDMNISYLNNKEVFRICRALGAPYAKKCGIYFYVKAGDTVKSGQKVATVYAESQDRLQLGINVWNKVEVFGKKNS